MTRKGLKNTLGTIEGLNACGRLDNLNALWASSSTSLLQHCDHFFDDIDGLMYRGENLWRK